MSETPQLPRVYSLTDITGRTANTERTVLEPLFKTQIKWTTMRAMLISLAITLPIIGLTTLLLGEYSIIIGVFTYALTTVLLTWRSSTLGENAAVSIYKRYKDTPGIVYISGKPATFTIHTGILAHRPHQ